MYIYNFLLINLCLSKKKKICRYNRKMVLLQQQWFHCINLQGHRSAKGQALTFILFLRHRRRASASAFRVDKFYLSQFTHVKVENNVPLIIQQKYKYLFQLLFQNSSLM